MDTQNAINSNKIYEMDTDFTHIITPGECNYFTTQQLNIRTCNTSRNALSIIHFNACSLKHKFEKIKDLFSDVKTNFKVIAVTETWLTDTNVNDVQIEGYNLIYQNRTNKRGGGVAIYIDKNLNCKIVEQKTTLTDLMEVLTIEIMLDTDKNMIVSCIYRPPGPGIDEFTSKIV